MGTDNGKTVLSLKDYSLLMLSILHGFENMGYNDCFHVEIGMLTAETVFRHSI